MGTDLDLKAQSLQGLDRQLHRLALKSCAGRAEQANGVAGAQTPRLQERPAWRDCSGRGRKCRRCARRAQGGSPHAYGLNKLASLNRHGLSLPNEKWMKNATLAHPLQGVAHLLAVAQIKMPPLRMDAGKPGLAHSGAQKTPVVEV